MSEQSIVTLSLQPLTQSQIGSLVSHLPRDIVRSIQIHAGGNPFFAEELARVSETSLLSSASPDAEIAGNRAFSLPAYSEAEHYYRHAIEAITGGKQVTSAASEDDPLHLAYLLEQVAECNAVKGNYDEVRHLYEHVLELRNQHQISAQDSALAQKGEAEVHRWRQQEAQMQALIRLLGRILAAQGQREQADRYFEQAINVFNKYEMRLDYARALHGYGFTLLQRSVPGDETYQRGIVYLRQACDLFRNCGAAIDLDLVERILTNVEYQNTEVL